MSVATYTNMIGVTMSNVSGKTGDDTMSFVGTNGKTYTFLHHGDCCEYVRIEDIIGDVSDLVGSPIVEAEEISSENEPAPANADSYTWTFYRFSTVKGTVTVRWLGESNGYYSESVDYEES